MVKILRIESERDKLLAMQMGYIVLQRRNVAFKKVQRSSFIKRTLQSLRR